MADETAEPNESAEPDFRAIIGKDQEYHFASGVATSRPQHMVYLDFFQVDPQSDPKVARTVARLVMLPSVVDTLLDQLTKLRADNADAQDGDSG
jgi:hypothetical protein